MSIGDLHHILRPPLEPGPAPAPAVVFLHGRGADEHDLMGLADLLDPRFACVSVRAPWRYSWGGYTWYEFTPDGSPDPEMFRTGYDGLAGLLRRLPGMHGLDPARIFLFGFSMGAAMAHVILLRDPGLVRGIVAASGYVPESVLPTDRPALPAGTAVFLSHGTHDPVLPVDMGRRARELYDALPVRLTWHEFPGGHEIPEDTAGAAALFLAGLLTAGPEADHA